MKQADVKVGEEVWTKVNRGRRLVKVTSEAHKSFTGRLQWLVTDERGKTFIRTAAELHRERKGAATEEVPAHKVDWSYED